ncbi:MAG: type III-B CRISPR module-associated protein Cmr5 [Chitinivibrionales bacterium]|nr:type III-B CRISPR module-associated protein Cmr5 [Chitinivibrionales bacterium]
MRTKEQKRAEFALRKIEEFGQGPTNEVSKENANFLVGMPTTILTNGLGQSLAFLLSKKPTEKDKINRDKHILTFKTIQEWLTDPEEGIETLKDSKEDERSFLKKMAKLEQSVYLKAQEETLKLLSWLKRYARAFQAPDTDKQEDPR